MLGKLHGGVVALACVLGLVSVLGAQSLSLDGTVGQAMAAIADVDGADGNELILAYGLGYASPHMDVLSYQSGGWYRPAWAASMPFSEAAEMSVASGDVNGDGQAEVVVMNATPHDINANGRIRIYRWNGTTYQLLKQYGLSDGFRRIAIGNIDSDSAEEIVIGNSYYDRTLYYYDYISGAMWTKKTIERVNEDCFGLQVADADNDGHKEIVATFGVWPPYSLRIYKKNVSGVMTKIWSYSFCNVSPYGPAYWVYVGDTDNDDANEILVTEEAVGVEGNPYDVFVFECNGDSTWRLAWKRGFGLPNAGARCPYIGPILNGDVNEFCFISADKVYVHRWNGTTYAQITTKVIAPTLSSNYPPVCWLTGGDPDNDGQHELVAMVGMTPFILGTAETYVGSPSPREDGPAGENMLEVEPLRMVAQSPFRGEGRISFSLPRPGNAVLKVSDVTGRTVRALEFAGRLGANDVTWNGLDDHERRVARGAYFYTLSLDGTVVASRRAVKFE